MLVLSAVEIHKVSVNPLFLLVSASATWPTTISFYELHPWDSFDLSEYTSLILENRILQFFGKSLQYFDH